MDSVYLLKTKLTVLAPLLKELSERMERIKKKSKVSGWEKMCWMSCGSTEKGKLRECIALLWTECFCSPKIRMLKSNTQCDGIRK